MKLLKTIRRYWICGYMAGVGLPIAGTLLGAHPGVMHIVGVVLLSLTTLLIAIELGLTIRAGLHARKVRSSRGEQ